MGLASHRMRRAAQFPLPFKSNRSLTGGRGGAYLVGSMFTASYSQKAARLAASCEKFGLSFEIHEVPTIHRSISPAGTDDLSYTKPNFIRHLIASHRKPVLYVDADCEFVADPVAISCLVDERCDFAVYNWCADDCTDQFLISVYRYGARRSGENRRRVRSESAVKPRAWFIAGISLRIIENLVLFTASSIGNGFG